MWSIFRAPLPLLTTNRIIIPGRCAFLRRFGPEVSVHSKRSLEAIGHCSANIGQEKLCQLLGLVTNSSVLFVHLPKGPITQKRMVDSRHDILVTHQI